MKGDKFREMAARCGELPDSVMAVPGLGYVGEKSAEWTALLEQVGIMLGVGPFGSAADLAMVTRVHGLRGRLGGLARFAALMAIVTREE